MVQTASPHTQHVLVGVHSSLQRGCDELWRAVGGQDVQGDDVCALHKDGHTVDLKIEALGNSTVHLMFGGGKKWT